MDRINVRVGQRLKRRLESEAKAKGVRPSQVVRDALEAHLKEEPGESCLDVLRRLGLLDGVDGLPPDLSTNRDYFEGFGRD